MKVKNSVIIDISDIKEQSADVSICYIKPQQH